MVVTRGHKIEGTVRDQAGRPVAGATVSFTNYGYVIVSRNANGNLTVTAYDYMSGSVLDTF